MTYREKLIHIHRASRTSIPVILDGLTPERMNWKLAPESRSIAEIMRHLIRVDIWFLKRLNLQPEVEDKEHRSAEELTKVFVKLWLQIEREIMAYPEADFYTDLSISDKIAYKSAATIFAHIPQHYLYHISQMVYIRRALDRTWPAPLTLWEHATDAIQEAILNVKP